MSIEVGVGNVVYEGEVKSVEKSLIPQIFIVTVEGSGVRTVFDIHKTLMNFGLNDKVRMTVSRSRPNFKEDVDLVMRGYVISKKVEEGIYKLLISLWGFLLIVESKNDSIFNAFDYMDEIYFKVEVI